MSDHRVCVSHHYACDCREARFAGLEAALEAERANVRHWKHLHDQQVGRKRATRERLMEVGDRLREAEKLLARFSPTKHDTGCPMHVMHDDFYENPDPDEHPDYPRRCDCGYDDTRAFLGET